MKPHYYQFLVWYLLLLLAVVACGASGLFGEAPASDLSSYPDVTWVLLAYGPENNPTPVLADGRVTLKFDFDANTVGGNASCNHYSGSFSIRGDRLSISQLMSTLMACYPEEVMQQESTYTAMLGQVVSYQLSEDTLVLSTEDGQILKYQLALEPQSEN